MPKVSIIIPIHEMKNGAFFLWRAVNSIMGQTFKDYEIVIVKEGEMAENTNAGIKKAKGELIKILYMDDYFAHENSLADIVETFTGDWLITGTNTNINPIWTDNIQEGNNKLGSPSALTMKRESALLFDERMSWLLDCDLYYRLYGKYGEPQILSGMNVCIGVHDGQMTNILTNEEKLAEHNLMKKKYE